MRALWVILLIHPAFGADRYVSLDGTNDFANKFNTWSGAATDIQWAVNNALVGETVWVSNGTYYLTNQVSIAAGITVKSFSCNWADTTINGNNYNLVLNFYAFDVFVEGVGYLLPEQRYALINRMDIPHVPAIVRNLSLRDALNTKEKILRFAEGYTSIPMVEDKCLREGFVFKSMTQAKSFKAVSNSWLLRYE